MTSSVAVVGLTWDGYDVQRSDLDVFLEITEGLDELPELRSYRHVIPFRHGQRPDLPYAHGRPLVLTGLISGPSATERAGYRGYVDEVKQAFSPFRAEPGILVATLEDGTVRWIRAMPLDLRPASIVPGASTVSIELLADDPFWYSAYGTLDMDDGVEMDDDELMDAGGEIVVTSPTTEVIFDSQGTAEVERIRVRFIGASGGSVGIENLSTPESVGFTIARTLAGDVLDVPQYEATALVTVPVGYWRVGEPSGAAMVDVMGANNGVYVNTPTLGVPGLLTGDPDTAVTLAGVGVGPSVAEFITVADSATFNCLEGTAAWSFAIWVSHTPDANYRPLMYKTDGASGWAFISSQNGTLIASRHNSGGGDDLTVSPLSAGRHLVVATYSGSALALYVDGALASGGTNPLASTRSLPALTSSLHIGADGWFGGNGLGTPFNGTLDEPAVWNRALSAAEIETLYEVGTNLPPIVTPAERVTVNNYARTAKLGGATNVRGDMTLMAGNRHGEYLRLIPGSNTLRILGAPAECRISFFPTWS